MRKMSAPSHSNLDELNNSQSEKCAKQIISKQGFSALKMGALTSSIEQFRFLEFSENIDYRLVFSTMLK